VSDPGIDSSPGNSETAIPLHTIGEIVEPLSSKADLLAPKSASSKPQSEHSFYRPIVSLRQSVRKAPPLALPAIMAMVLIRQAKRVSWYKRSGNVDLAAVLVVLALACCTAYSDRGSFPHSEFTELAKTPAVVQEISLSPQKPASLESHSRLSGRRISTRKVRRSPQHHQAVLAGPRVVHIGEDVTVRYFSPPPMPHKAPVDAHQVVRKGDDVTVRYFAPVRGDSKKDGRSVEATDRKRLGLAAGPVSGLRASGTKTPD
jgi:hypothetical protein